MIKYWRNPFQTRKEQTRILGVWLDDIATKMALATGEELEELNNQRLMLTEIRDHNDGRFHLYEETGKIGLPEWIMAQN